VVLDRDLLEPRRLRPDEDRKPLKDSVSVVRGTRARANGPASRVPPGIASTCESRPSTTARYPSNSPSANWTRSRDRGSDRARDRPLPPWNDSLHPHPEARRDRGRTPPYGKSGRAKRGTDPTGAQSAG
jgi:hypothetical protein